MKGKKTKKIIVGSILGAVFLLLVLAVHIYLVTRPKAPDAYTRIMARIDIKQPVTEADSTNYTAWLYKQKGIDHVLINPATRIGIFTFFPVKTTADDIVNNFRSHFNINAVRYVPTAEEMQSGCPVAKNSSVFKIYNFFKSL